MFRTPCDCAATSLHAREEARHLAHLELGRVRPRGARDRDGPGGARLRARALREHPRQHGRRMGACRPRGAVRRRREQRIYPTDAPPQVHYLCEDSATRSSSSRTTSSSTRSLEVRDRLPQLGWIVVFDMEGLARLRPAVMSLERLREIGREEYDAAHPGESERRRGAPTRGPGDPDLHLGHHRPAPGRDARARRHRLHRARLQHPDRPGRGDERCASCRCATLPSGWAASTSRSTPGRRSTSSRTPTPCRERARDRADGDHRGAAGVGEVLLRR